MKTKTKMLLAIGLIVALWAGFFIGISLDNSKPDKADLAGTLGKAEQYRKAQLTAKDIQLRSELVKDTAKLKSMIRGLAYLSVFTEDVGTNLELALITFSAKGMGKPAEEAGQISALQDYSDFIRDNHKTLNANIAMLSSFYRNDSASQLQDAGKNLRDFATYTNNLNEKNSALKLALASMDGFLLSSKVLPAGKTEFEQLKSIRDQLLVKGIRLGGILNDKDQVKSLIRYAFAAQEQYQSWAAEQLPCTGEHGAREKLKTIVSGESIQSYLAGQSVTAGAVNPGLTGVAVVYDKPDLQFVIIPDRARLNQNDPGKAGLDDLCMIGTDKLNVVLANYSLQQVVAAHVYEAVKSRIIGYLAWDNLGQTIARTAGISEMLRMESDR